MNRSASASPASIRVQAYRYAIVRRLEKPIRAMRWWKCSLSER
jgi:hypothetical protein